MYNVARDGYGKGNVEGEDLVEVGADKIIRYFGGF
jgi:hypothetical protein